MSQRNLHEYWFHWTLSKSGFRSSFSVSSYLMTLSSPIWSNFTLHKWTRKFFKISTKQCIYFCLVNHAAFQEQIDISMPIISLECSQVIWEAPICSHFWCPRATMSALSTYSRMFYPIAYLRSGNPYPRSWCTCFLHLPMKVQVAHCKSNLHLIAKSQIASLPICHLAKVIPLWYDMHYLLFDLDVMAYEFYCFNIGINWTPIVSFVLESATQAPLKLHFWAKRGTVLWALAWTCTITSMFETKRVSTWQIFGGLTEKELETAVEHFSV